MQLRYLEHFGETLIVRVRYDDKLYDTRVGVSKVTALKYNTGMPVEVVGSEK